MFKAAAIAKPKQQTGKLVPIPLPAKGLNVQALYGAMAPDYALALVNVIDTTYGMRTRKGFTEYATGLPGGDVPANSMLQYYSAAYADSTPSTVAPYEDRSTIMFTAPAGVDPPTGKLFAAKGGSLYNVSAGGVGPWTAEVGVSGGSDYWTAYMFQNVAGAYLIATCEAGGYAYYNGTNWSTPTFGGGAGQIAGCDPALFAFCVVWKKQIWFIEKESTRAWYLPAEQITGTVTKFDFGSLLSNGGELIAIASWTMDAGSGIDDRLVVVGGQGDVCIYQGTDASDPSTFSLIGSYWVGPLPVGRRQVYSDGGDVYILSQFGLSAVSKLISAAGAEDIAQNHLSWLIDPLVSRLMQTMSNYQGWSIGAAPKENILLIGLPQQATTVGGDFLVYSTTTKGWSEFWDTQYACYVSDGAQMFGCTYDGRVVRVFDGTLDDVQIGGSSGTAIECVVTPAYNSLGNASMQKRLQMLRPTFISASTPLVSVTVLSDYGQVGSASTSSAAAAPSSLWGASLWGTAVWGGLLAPIKKWIGCKGLGFVLTSQLTYQCGGDTLLVGLDYWVSDGGPL